MRCRRGCLSFFALLSIWSAAVGAKTFFVTGSVQPEVLDNNGDVDYSGCTPTCLSFAFLAAGSEFNGFITLDDAGIADGAFVGADVDDLAFEVFDPATAQFGPSSPPNPVTDNPFVIDQSADGGGIIVARGQAITNPRGTWQPCVPPADTGCVRTSTGTTNGEALTGGFIDLWLTQGVLAANGAVITLKLDEACATTDAGVSLAPPCFEVRIFERQVYVASGQFTGITELVSVDQDTLDFGAVEVGASAQKSVTLTNDVFLDVTFQAPEINGTADFSVADDGCSAALGFRGGCEITVEFAPSVEGDAEPTTLIVPFTDADGVTQTVEVALVGSGTLVPTPNLVLDPATVDFGPVETGATGDATLSVSNSGSADLTISAVATTDTLDAPFAITGEDCTGAVLAAGEACTVSLSFAPADAEAFTDTFNISSDDPDSADTTATLAGTGVLPPPPAPGSQTTEPPDFALEDPGGGGCFIATAAYGSYLDPHVRVLRAFRDDVLARTASGRAFIRFYYRNSPPIADYIAKHDGLRAATRFALTPLVYSLEYPDTALATLLAGWLLVRARRSRAAASDPRTGSGTTGNNT